MFVPLLSENKIKLILKFIIRYIKIKFYHVFCNLIVIKHLKPWKVIEWKSLCELEIKIYLGILQVIFI